MEILVRRSIDDILDSDQFNDFCEEAKKMNLDFSMQVGEKGVPERGSLISRCATFLELKLLVWKHFPGILLEDIVM